jgi:hypothetical protein
LNFEIISKRNCKILSNFKNVDLFFINIAKKTFKQISFYLNSKYDNNNLNINKIELFDKQIQEKKVIKLYSVGSFNTFYKNVLLNDITKLLGEKFIFNFTPDNPEYLIYDVFSCDHLDSRYDNAIKIAFYTENIIPDFNDADYSIGFHNMHYLDRYFRKTTLIWVFQKRYLNIKNKFFDKMKIKAYRSKKKKNFVLQLYLILICQMDLELNLLMN